MKERNLTLFKAKPEVDEFLEENNLTNPLRDFLAKEEQQKTLEKYYITFNERLTKLFEKWSKKLKKQLEEMLREEMSEEYFFDVVKNDFKEFFVMTLKVGIAKDFQELLKVEVFEKFSKELIQGLVNNTLVFMCNKVEPGQDQEQVLAMIFENLTN